MFLCLHVCSPPQAVPTSIPARLHACSAPLELQRSMPLYLHARYAYSAPPRAQELQSSMFLDLLFSGTLPAESMIPPVYQHASSAPPELHSSMRPCLRIAPLQPASRATGFHGSMLPRLHFATSTTLLQRFRDPHVYTPAAHVQALRTSMHLRQLYLQPRA